MVIIKNDFYFFRGLRKMNSNFHEEYMKEKSYLEYVFTNLNKELNLYLERRKEISQVIIDYRKKFIEEYRDDDDKIIEYFDHENHKNEQIFNTVEKRIREFLSLKKSPYFGKIKILEDGVEEDFYIGSYGFDIGEEIPLIVDWRAPISSLFYQGKLGEVKYTLPSKEDVFVNLIKRRQFLIKNGEIISMFDSEVDIKDEFLKEMLSIKASDKLKNIVQTIQSNQDKIIRIDKNKAVVINGVAGSGKTSIALHRIAYLLYNYRDYFKDKVLILCPNKIFMEYISMVLPSLGEYGGVFSYTSEDFIYLSMNEDLNFNSYDNHMEKVLNCPKYLEEFVFKGSKEMKVKIDEFLSYVEKNINLGGSIYFRDIEIISSDEINRLFYESFKSRVLEVRVDLIRRRILDRINKVRNKLVYEVVSKYENMNIEEDMINHYDMLRKNEIYEIVSEAMEIKSSLRYLKLESPYELYKEFYEEFFLKDLKELDFSDLILIKYIHLKMFNVKRDRDFKLVVIDEAQDFSYMFYEVIKEFTKASSYIIVGDLNQSIIKFKENFLHSTEIFKNKIYMIMEDSYRSTKNIIEYSKKYLSENVSINSIREGKDVKILECCKDDFKGVIQKIISDFRSSGNSNMGILVRDKTYLEKTYDMIKDLCYIKVIDNEDHVYSDNGIFLTTVYFSKGLEFDSVIVLDEGFDNNILYVMLTRGMHEVTHIKLKNVIH